jgi:hypothetical protein
VPLRSVRATRFEKARELPGDGLVSEPLFSATHAVTIRRSPRDVWPWLAQMGAGRAGWYSYDFIDNGGRRSAERILPALQNIGVGNLLPSLPGATDGFLVLRCEPESVLVLGHGPMDGGAPLSTWTFVLEEPATGLTRLVTRGFLSRGRAGRRPYGLPPRLLKLLGPIGHFLMQRRQLLGIARRAEAAGAEAA